MALVYVTLQNKFSTIFKDMVNMHKNGDTYMAQECSKAIADYISQGQVNTTDTGVGSKGGVYTGSSINGTMTINQSLLYSKFLSTFTSKSNETELARRIANDIDSVCSVTDTISTTSVGNSTSTNPPPPTYPDGGSGKGDFKGSSAIIFSALNSCFSAMRNMHSAYSGDTFFAQEWAKAVDNYLKSGNIIITRIPPLPTASGSGKIS